MGRVHQVHEVDVARAEVRQPHVVVRDDPEDEPVELRLARVEVVRGLLQHDPVLGDALGERPGTDAHRRGAELVVELPGLRRRDRHAGAVGEDGGDRRERRLQAQADGRRIDDVDRVDVIQLASATGPLHLPVPVERELHRLGGHRRAVVELHARAKLDRDGLAGVGEGRQLRRELREDLEALVDLVELLAHVLEDDAPDVRAGQGGVQDVRILVQPDHEGLLLRLGRSGRHEGAQQDRHRVAQSDPHRRCPPHSASRLIKGGTTRLGAAARWSGQVRSRFQDASFRKMIGRRLRARQERAAPPAHPGQGPAARAPRPPRPCPPLPTAGLSRPRARPRSPRSAATSRPPRGCRAPAGGLPSAPRARRAPAPRQPPARSPRT